MHGHELPAAESLVEVVSDLANSLLARRDEIIAPAIEAVKTRFSWLLSQVSEPEEMHLLIQKSVIAGFFIAPDDVKTGGLFGAQAKAVQSVVDEINSAVGCRTLSSLIMCLIEDAVVQGYALHRSLDEQP